MAKPTDWSHVISVSGYHSLPEPAKYQPSEALMNFLNSGPPPIYIGFGSIVVDDPAALTQIVLQAVHMAGVRAIISHGWCQLGTGATAAPDINSSSDAAPALDHTVFLLSSCPHHWLFPRVSCVVHHGGAGTTAAGLAAGKPTIVVPFFGDQQFWGNMIHRQGVGPQPLPARELTAEKLAAAITYATNDHVVKTRAAGVKERVGKEDGVGNAVKHFHQCLPDSMFANTHCQTPARLSVWRYVKKGRKAHVDIPLSAVAATVLIKEKLINWDDLKLYVFPLTPAPNSLILTKRPCLGSATSNTTQPITVPTNHSPARPSPSVTSSTTASKAWARSAMSSSERRMQVL